MKEGEQAYVVVPAIDESEMELRTAEGTQKELQKDWLLKEFRVGLIHGRMARETRQHIMERFRQHLIDVLVATTVIEVGVDVPNATMMVVEHADRFGLSQLHQLRGRVGRGKKKSYCVLLADQGTEEGTMRLQAMVKYASGFQIAEEDLKLRGMGHMIVGTSAERAERICILRSSCLIRHLLPLSEKGCVSIWWRRIRGCWMRANRGVEDGALGEVCRRRLRLRMWGDEGGGTCYNGAALKGA